MPLLDWLTKNWADLEPIALEGPPSLAVARAAEVIARLTRWKVVAADPEAGTLHATHATRVWRFIDDIHLRFKPEGGGTRVVGRSRSRIGKGDLGQNARNLRELAAALRSGAS